MREEEAALFLFAPEKHASILFGVQKSAPDGGAESSDTNAALASRPSRVS